MPRSRLARLDPSAYALPAAVRARLLSPALVIYLDKVRENIRSMVAYTGGADRWRPHVKTTKLPPVFAELAKAGVRHYKCATVREAQQLLETLADAGVADGDVLLAYPLRPPALDVLGELGRRHPGARLSVLCEDPSVVPDIPDDVTVFVDVNPGMHRTGVPLAQRDAIHAVATAAGARFRGVHYYDGHLHGDPAERPAETAACYDALMQLRAELVDAGHAVGELITSGTPTFRHALAYEAFAALDGSVHRVSPGTVVFHDQRSDEDNPDVDLVPAALLFTRVVSHPAPDLATCDAGSKSIAAEAGDPCAFVLGHPHLRARSPSEEHLPLSVEGGERPARGAELLLVPRHVCPTVNLAEEVVLVDDGRVGSARVTARAHPLWADEALGPG